MSFSSGVGGFGTGFSSGSGTGQADELKSQTFPVMDQTYGMPAWQKQVTGQAFDNGILTNYLNNYVNPVIQRQANARINQARNQYNTPSGYFSASNALAQQRAMYDAGESMAGQAANTSMNWQKMKNDAILDALKIPTQQTAVYRPGSQNIAVPSLNYPSGAGARNISGYSDLSFGNMGWNAPRTTGVNTGGMTGTGPIPLMGIGGMSNVPLGSYIEGYGYYAPTGTGTGYGAMPTSNSTADGWKPYSATLPAGTVNQNWYPNPNEPVDLGLFDA